MEKKRNVGKLLPVLVAFCLLLVSGCDLCPEPISRHNFGKVYVGTTADSPQVRWRNHGKNALEVASVIVIPPVGTFAIKSPRPLRSFVLQSGDCSEYFTFTFTPTQKGVASGEANPQLISGKGTVQALELSGTGVCQIAEGVLIIGGGHMKAGQVLDFGSVVFRERGGATSQRRFNLVNATNQQIQLDVVWSKGSQGFSVVQPVGQITVPALNRRGVTLQFSPPGVGVFTGGVTFIDRANRQNKAGTAVVGKGTRAE